MSSQADERDLYVGYLPTPARTARLMRLVVPVLIIGLGLVAGVVAGLMKPTGSGVWDLGETLEVRGVIRDVGYPVLMVGDGADAEPVLLVGELKSGVRAQLGESADGAAVVIRGNPVTRGSLRMLSLVAGDDAVEIAAQGSGVRRASGEMVELTGEIVDSKCYLGAMKPGEGKTHKACAILCVRGGVPPVLITDAGAWVLTTAGGLLDERWYDFIGEPVTVRGRAGEAFSEALGVVDVDSIVR